MAITPGTGVPSAMPILALRPQGTLGDVQDHAVPALAVVEILPPDLASWVEAITVDYSSTRPAVVLDLVGSATVLLGPADNLADKLDAVRSVLAGVELECLSEIDARVPDHPTVTRDTICEATSVADTVDVPSS